MSTKSPVYAAKSEGKRLVSQICEQAVDDLFEARQNHKKSNVLLFSLSGRAKDTKAISEYIARITSGLTIVEALAVVTTNPMVMKTINTFEAVNFGFNPKGLKYILNNMEPAEGR
jgi:hypothetical protein